MATYKVLQDIEAEDKLLGPLSLRQFIYAVIVVVMSFIAYQFGRINIFLVIPWLIPIGFFGLLAAPFGVYQSSEIWLLGKIRYFIYPKKRIWDQAGIEELVTITAPKQMEEHFSDNLGQEEVKSRLEALAKTLDSRGWALRTSVQQEAQATPTFGVNYSQERLVAIPNLPDQNAIADSTALDVQEAGVSPLANRMEELLSSSESEKQQRLQSLVGAQETTTPSNQGGVDEEAKSIIEEAKREYEKGMAEEKRRLDDENTQRPKAAPTSANNISTPQPALSVQPNPRAGMTIGQTDGKIKDEAKVAEPPVTAQADVKPKPEAPKTSSTPQPTEVSTSEDGEVTLSLH
ncbi:MAG: PrgI family protein [bacterium]|nr:PrgI family protein [bacterium]